jgi:predicted metal-dependent hydrolase
MNNEIGFSLFFKRHRQAKRMKLRYDAVTDSAIVTMPLRSSEKEARKFAENNISWLQVQRQNSPVQQSLLPGFTIPYKGFDLSIIHKPDMAGRVTFTEDKIIVGGTIEGFSVRLGNHLKKQARRVIEPLAYDMAERTNKSFKRIQIRDTKSRWGSCSSSGNLSFSWRLIMAAPEILEYVVAHEVAHLSEMNHSADFWEVVALLVFNAKQSRKWLKTEGQKLMLIKSC